MSHFLIRYLWLGMALCCWTGVEAQSWRAYEKAGDAAAEARDYHAAVQHYAKALGIRPDHAGLGFKYAGIAQRFQAFEIAQEWYGKVIAHKEAERFPLALFQLGMVEKSMGRYQEARRRFEQYLEKYGDADPAHAAQAREQMAQCEWALQLLSQPPAADVVRLDKQVNSVYTEFGPVPVGDTLYFSSLRFENKKDQHLPKRLVAKVLSWNPASAANSRPLRDDFNSDTRHTAHFAVSEITRRVYFTRCEYISAAEIRCALYYREPDKRGRLRGADVRLPDIVNVPGYTATQPSVGYDSIGKAEILFFVSDRPGGSGGLDIWQCFVLDDGKFSPPKPALAINTPEDDITPFFHTPTQTLYFSTNGRKSLGGLDIYASKKGRFWHDPVHLGPPINSSYNDLYFSLSADGLNGYLASNRPGSLYLDAANKACCNDIYRFQLKPPPPPEAPQPLEQAPVPPPIAPQPVAPPPKMPQTLEEFLPLALYFDNDEPDPRTRRTTTQQTYATAYNRYFLRKAEYVRQYAAGLEGDALEDAENKMIAFFEKDIRLGYEKLLRFSEILLARLQSGDQVEIFIKGFTSPRAQSDYNLALGARRVSSVRNHFQSWQGGAFLPYLRSGQLKISERSFGEATASKDISDALDDLRGSIFSLGAMRERRVEIVEITVGR